MEAAMARGTGSYQTKQPQSRSKSGRYQPYNATHAVDTTDRSTDEGSRSSRPISHNRRNKVGGGNSSASNHNFTASTDTRGLSACAICLGRNPHDVTQCDASLLWDGHIPSFARKGDKGAKLQTASSGDTLCLDWNLPKASNSNPHQSRHRCSGCGNNDHEAQS